MVVRTLNVKKDHFQPTNDDEKILGPEVPYLSAMAALLFLATHTRIDISFPLKLLARPGSPTVVHEDNATYIAQLKDEDKTKHILLKFFFSHDLQKSGDIIVQTVRLSDNQADLFTKALPTTTFKKMVHDTGMRSLNKLK
nr:retrotransposon like protein [Tanacetum cinerariifolium]